jgi:hypothetical protein
VFICTTIHQVLRGLRKFLVHLQRVGGFFHSINPINQFNPFGCGFAALYSLRLISTFAIASRIFGFGRCGRRSGSFALTHRAWSGLFWAMLMPFSVNFGVRDLL